MNTLTIKRTVISVLSICLLFIPFGTISANAAQAPETMPLYNNTSSTISAMSINDDGIMTISYRYSGYPNVTTKAVITTYIEKKTLGLFWTRVDIGQNNDEWVDTINDYRYSGSRTFQLSSTGKYRVSVEYKIYGNGGSADIITYEKTETY